MTRLRRSATLLAILLLLASLVPLTANAGTVWRLNLYRSSGFLYQDPYYTACTAAATMMMLNFIDLNDSGGARLPLDDVPDEEQLGEVERPRHDLHPVVRAEPRHAVRRAAGQRSPRLAERAELLRLGRGRAHGLVEAGYDDHAYTSFDAALKEAVTSMARFRKPVGVAGPGRRPRPGRDRAMS